MAFTDNIRTFKDEEQIKGILKKFQCVKNVEKDEKSGFLYITVENGTDYSEVLGAIGNHGISRGIIIHDPDNKGYKWFKYIFEPEESDLLDMTRIYRLGRELSRHLSGEIIAIDGKDVGEGEDQGKPLMKGPRDVVAGFKTLDTMTSTEVFDFLNSLGFNARCMLIRKYPRCEKYWNYGHPLPPNPK